jgi:hypothetical protein
MFLESITVVTVLLYALERVPLQAVFDRDPSESRRAALPGARLLKVLLVYQMIRSEKMRGLVQTIAEHAGLPHGLGRESGAQYLVQCRGRSATSNRWSRPAMLVLQTYGPWLGRMGKKFARIAV